MYLFPAIDILDGAAVRLYKGDYAQKTVYSENPASVAADFAALGAKFIHTVDLGGAKTGGTPAFDSVLKIKETSGAFVEIGGGIRNMQVVEKYLGAGLDRVILGTAAVEDPEFRKAAADKYGDRIAVGMDLKDGFVAVRGWTEKSQLDAFTFCDTLVREGISTVICTDISKDGAMAGTNRELYRELTKKFRINVVASGGVSSLDDVEYLASMGLYGAIIGKAYYTGDIDLKKALEVAG